MSRVLFNRIFLKRHFTAAGRPNVIGQSPNPNYKPGDPTISPFQNSESDFQLFNVNDEKNKSIFYKLFISAVTPRPIAFISTKGLDGICNVSPYSFFNAMGYDPPTLVFGCLARRNETGESDTLKNLKETKTCVVNIISDWFVEASNHSCGPYDPNVDEIPLSGLTTLPSTVVDVPRIKESAVQMECKLHQLVPMENDSGKITQTICIVKVVAFHINKHVYDEKSGVVDTEALKPVARLGGDAYSSLGNIYNLARPNKDGSPGKLRFG